MDFIELEGVALRYELTGKGDHTLVLVHDGISPRITL